MANVSGTLLKKARLAADLTQKELADAVEGISPQDISKAERGIADLTPEQLNAVANVLGTTAEELTTSEDTGASGEDTLSDIAAEEVSVPEDPQEEAATAEESEACDGIEQKTSDEPGTVPEAEDKTIIDLYRAADPARQKAAISVLKGEKQVCPDIMSMFAGMMSGMNSGDLMKKVNTFINSETGKSIMNTVKSMAANAASAKGEPNEKAIFTSLPTFTYIYSVSIYLLFLSFYFWQLRTDIKPEK